MYPTSESLKKRLKAPGPKRILSLDGGGIRGAMTLGFLEKMEEILAAKHAEKKVMPKEEFRLHHYFDLIGGTSTGSIIAALLAIGGHKVSEIKEMYRDLGKKIFSDKNGLNIFGKRIYVNRKYDSAPLKEELQKIFGDTRLGDDTNKTGFCAVTKRLDTFSTWPVTNNPDAIYYEKNRFLVRNIVRASTAAPSFFEPEIVDVGDEKGVFVDGGMSMMNNPSLQLFLTATLDGYKLKWETGPDKLLIISVGTGRRDKKLLGDKYNDPNLLVIAQLAPDQFMSDANELVELMMHFIGKGLGKLRKIDRELGDLSKDAINGQKAFSYLRYNVEMDLETFARLKLEGIEQQNIDDLMNMDAAKNVEELLQIGETAAKEQVSPDHFPAAFDLVKK
ncbi:MAG TPA: patatin-like phospholipase family protein [Chryseolinea sp.]|nr:patatin-like phospholipase family protein [Chryseolinea sp.]